MQDPTVDPHYARANVASMKHILESNGPYAHLDKHAEEPAYTKLAPENRPDEDPGPTLLTRVPKAGNLRCVIPVVMLTSLVVGLGIGFACGFFLPSGTFHRQGPSTLPHTRDINGFSKL